LIVRKRTVLSNWRSCEDPSGVAEENQLLYVAAATAAKLTITKVDDHGVMSAFATVPTTAGVRSVIAAGHETCVLD
jgi:hypothetical protein